MALTLAFLLFAPSSAQEKTTLKWKFEKGKTFYQEMTQEVKMTMNAGAGGPGSQVLNTVKQTWYISWTPEEQQKDKGWRVRLKILGVKLEMDFLGQKIEYDSTNPGAGGKVLADRMQPLIGAEFQLTLGPDLKAAKVEGYQELLDKFGKVNARVKDLIGAILTEDSIKYISDQCFAFTPPREVKKGDTWTADIKLPLGSLGSWSGQYRNTYEGKADNLDKIKVEVASLNYEPPVAKGATGVPFKVKKVELKSSSGTGTLLFDTDKGRVANATYLAVIQSKVLSEADGREMEVAMKQDQKVTIKTSDKNPLGR
jgi:hypothetical protein